jgi:hypothetical protein
MSSVADESVGTIGLSVLNMKNKTESTTDDGINHDLSIEIHFSLINGDGN